LLLLLLLLGAVNSATILKAIETNKTLQMAIMGGQARDKDPDRKNNHMPCTEMFPNGGELELLIRETDPWLVFVSCAVLFWLSGWAGAFNPGVDCGKSCADVAPPPPFAWMTSLFTLQAV
jgi:hypothetical protein